MNTRSRYNVYSPRPSTRSSSQTARPSSFGCGGASSVAVVEAAQGDEARHVQRASRDGRDKADVSIRVQAQPLPYFCEIGRYSAGQRGPPHYCGDVPHEPIACGERGAARTTSASGSRPSGSALAAGFAWLHWQDCLIDGTYDDPPAFVLVQHKPPRGISVNNPNQGSQQGGTGQKPGQQKPSRGGQQDDQKPGQQTQK